MKFNLNGDTLWQKIYRDTSQDLIPQIVAPSIDGGYLITGSFQDWVNHTRPCLLIKTDVNGNELWRRVINKTGKNAHDGRGIIQDSASKKILIVGYQYIGSSSNWDAYDNILILDSLGNNPMQYHYNKGYLMDLIQTKDKKFIGVGATETYNSTYAEYEYNSYMVKFDINNPSQTIWKNVIYDQTSRLNTFTCARELSNGEILIAGGIDSLKLSDTVDNTHIRFIKVNSSNGNVIWRKDYNYLMNLNNQVNDLAVTSLELTSDNGWVAAIRVVNSLTKPLFYVKYDSTGCDTSAQWCRSVELEINEYSKISGYSFDLFPNPSYNYVNIKIDAPVNKTFSLKITDVAGSLIYSTHILSNNSITLLSSDYKTGIYYVSYFNEDRLIETKKMVITH